MKRVGAIIAIFLLVSMYITALVCALIGSEFATSMLQASVFCTIFIPVLLYAYLFLTKAIHKDNDFLTEEDDNKDAGEE